MKSRLPVVLAVLATLLALTGCGDETTDPSIGTAPSDSATESSAATPATPDTDCSWVTDPAGAAKEVDPPPAAPVAATELTITTNHGDIKVQLDPDNAPCAAGSFTWLASQGYYDDTSCHRLVVGFVLQCGDPSGSGQGGPGYTFADELTGEEEYTAGTIAMANAGPDTNGSQFFVMLQDSPLPPSYTVFGRTDDAGLAVAREIEAAGTEPGTETPAEPVVIESIG